MANGLSISEMMLWCHGDLKKYIKIVKRNHAIERKIHKLSVDRDFEEDAMIETFNSINNTEYYKHHIKFKDICDKISKLQKELNENNERLKKEFY